MNFATQSIGLTIAIICGSTTQSSSTIRTEVGVRPLTSRRKLNQRERHPRSKVHLNPLEFCIGKMKSKPGGTAHFLCENSQSRLAILKAISSYGGPAVNWRIIVSSLPGSLIFTYDGVFAPSMRSG